MSTHAAATEFISFLKSDLREDQYVRFEAETDSQKIIDRLLFVAQLYPDQVLMLCNRSHPQLQYVAPNCEFIFGFSDKEFKSLTVQDFFNRIHPEDLAGLQQCFEFINGAEPYDPLTHRFVLYYRFKNKNGDFIHIRDEKLAIETERGKYIYFTMFKKMDTLEKFFHVKLDIHQYNKENSVKVYSYNPRQLDNFITPRQNDIIRLIIQGFSTQEIADRLHVSVNTIKNHKQALFRKVNVKSSVELINLATRP